MQITKKHYQYATNIFAGLAILWPLIGSRTDEIYYRFFDPHLVPDDGSSFNVFNEGIVLLFSSLGTIAGIINIKKNKVRLPGLYINTIIFCVVILIWTL